MKFTLSKTDLQDLLQIVGSAVPTRSTLPILSNVLVTADDTGVQFMATDLDLSIRTRGEATIDESGSVTIPSKRLNEIVRELPNDDVKISTNGTRVKLQCGNGSFTILGMDPEDYPELPKIDTGKMVSLSSSVLERGYRRTGYAVSADETRQMLTGVLLQTGDSELRMVATDGHRLAKAAFKGEFKSIGKDLIISPKALSQVVRLAGNHALVKLTVSKNFGVFEVGSTTIYTRLIDGSFPNYDQVIPKKSPIQVKVNREMLVGALRRVSVLSDQVTRQIKISLKPERLELSVRTADVGEGQESLGVDYSGEELAAGYNSAYMLDALKTMESEEVTLHLNTPTSPGVITPTTQEKEEDQLCLVMPLRLPEA